jgi:general stress protein 26
MSDLQSRIQSILSTHQLSSLATITPNSEPWVRYVMAAGAPDMRIRCASLAGARKVAQIRANPLVHLTCGVTDPAAMAPYLQVQGRAVFSVDSGERHSFWYPMLQQVFKGPDDPNYGVIIITPYCIEYCVPGVMQPEVWEASVTDPSTS